MKPSTFALLLAALPTSVFALGFRLVDHGAEATAKGGAFAATADNPSAIYHNPAGITQLSGLQVLMNGYFISLESTVDPSTPGARDFDGKYEWQAVPDMFLTWSPKDSPVSLGLGVYAPFGLGVEYPDDAVFRSLGTKGRIQFFTTNPVIAYEVTKELSVAVGATLNYSRAKLAQGLVTPVGEAPGSEFILEGAGFAVGVNAGMRWQPTDQWAFGVNYFGPMDLPYSGHARTRIPAFTGSIDFEVAPGVFAPVPVPVARLENEEDFNLDLTLPQTISGGVSFRPTPDWNFEVNVEWTDWDSLNEPTVHLSENLDSSIVFNYESSFMYEFGVTRKFTGGWTASAGYIYSENSVKNEYFNPLVADSNRHVLSAGVGRRYDHFNWYLAYQYSYGPHRDIERMTVADGNYRFQAHAVSFTMGYNF